MLSLKNISTAQAANYFAKDNYYTKQHHEVPSEWYGKGAEMLGLRGEISHAEYQNLISEIREAGYKRAGTDLVFSAPKSVSIAGEVLRDERVWEAHNRAVDVALERVEALVQTRVQRNGERVRVPTENAVIAKFHHNMSREMEPQIHTHAVVLNITNHEGKWYSVENRSLYQSKMEIGLIYRTALAENLRQIGYDIRITNNEKFLFEIQGIPKDLLREFSTRAQQIQEKTREIQEQYPHIQNESQLKEIATLASRQGKMHVDREMVEQIRNEWMERAQNVLDRLNEKELAQFQEMLERIQRIQETKERDQVDVQRHMQEQMQEKNREGVEVSIFDRTLQESVKEITPEIPDEKISEITHELPIHEFIRNAQIEEHYYTAFEIERHGGRDFYDDDEDEIKTRPTYTFDEQEQNYELESLSEYNSKFEIPDTPDQERESIDVSEVHAKMSENILKKSMESMRKERTSDGKGTFEFTREEFLEYAYNQYEHSYTTPTKEDLEKAFDKFVNFHAIDLGDQRYLALSQDEIHGKYIDSIAKDIIEKHGTVSVDDIVANERYKLEVEPFYETNMEAVMRHMNSKYLQVTQNTYIDAQSRAKFVLDQILDKITDRESVFKYEQLIAISEKFLKSNQKSPIFSKVKLKDIKKEVERQIREGNIIQLTQRIAGKGKNEIFLTTKRMYELERDNVDFANRTRGSMHQLFTPEQIKEQIARIEEQRGITLSAEQKQVIEKILTTQDKVTVIEGFAGTGKTTVMGVVADVIRERNIELTKNDTSAGIGFITTAPTGKATVELQKSLSTTDTKSELNFYMQVKTVEKFLQDPIIFANTILVVDEASQMSSEKLNEIFNIIAKDENARVVLIGDSRQLQAIAAGKPFADLRLYKGVDALLQNIQRQKNENLRQAVVDLARGRIADAIEKLRDNIREINEEKIISEYIKDYKNTLLIVPTKALEKRFNDAIQFRLLNEGKIGKNGMIEYTVREGKNLTSSEKKMVSNYKINDAIVFHRTATIENTVIRAGESGVVIGKDPEKNLLFVSVSDKNDVMGRNTLVVLDPRIHSNSFSVYTQYKETIYDGEKVMFTKNNLKHNIMNGDTGIVTSIERRGKEFEVVIRLERNGEEKSFKIGENSHAYFKPSYAITSYKSQGQTADRVMVVLPSNSKFFNANTFYVAASRARESLVIYTDRADKLKNLKPQEKTSTMDYYSKEQKSRISMFKKENVKGKQKQKKRTQNKKINMDLKQYIKQTKTSTKIQKTRENIQSQERLPEKNYTPERAR